MVVVIENRVQLRRIYVYKLKCASKITYLNVDVVFCERGSNGVFLANHKRLFESGLNDVFLANRRRCFFTHKIILTNQKEASFEFKPIFL